MNLENIEKVCENIHNPKEIFKINSKEVQKASHEYQTKKLKKLWKETQHHIEKIMTPLACVQNRTEPIEHLLKNMSELRQITDELIYFKPFYFFIRKLFL